MRFNTPVYFCKVTPGAYGADSVAETLRWADITDSSDRTVQLMYGALREGNLTVRLQRPYDSEFDYIKIGEKKYQPDKKRSALTKQAFIVSEVL